MSLYRETPLFYIKDYPKFKNFGIFPLKSKYLEQLDRLILFIQSNTSLKAERLSRSGFELISVPHQNKLDLNELEKIVHNFEIIRGINEKGEAWRRNLRKLGINLFYVILNEDANSMFVSVNNKTKIPWNQAVQMLQLVADLLKRETYSDEPLLINVRLSKSRMADRKPPGLFIEFQSKIYSQRIFNIIDQLDIEYFAPVMRKTEKTIRQDWYKEDTTVCDGCGRVCNSDEIIPSELGFSPVLCEDCHDDVREQQGFVESDYDFSKYLQWEGNTENNEEGKRETDENRYQ